MYMRILCASCNRTWDVQQSDDWKAEAARTCPRCGSKIDRQTWTRQIIPAFASTVDANAELFKDHTGYNSPLFGVEMHIDILSALTDIGPDE